MSTELQFISRTEATGVTSVSITDCFTFDYEVFVINIEDMIFSSRNAINLRFIDNSGSVISDAEYDRAQLQLRNDSSFSETNATGETSLSSITSSSGGSDEFGGTWIQVYNPNISSAFTFVTCQSSAYYDIVTGDLLGYKYVGVHKNAETLKGFQLLHAGGVNFEPIKVNVFGVG